MHNTHMNAMTIVSAILFTSLLGSQLQLFGQETASQTLPDDSAEVQKVHQALRAPDAWRAHEPTPEQVAEFQKQVRQIAVSFAEKAREFTVRFPTNENVGDARITVVHALSHAVAAGDADAERRIDSFVSKVLADSSIPEDDRVGVLLYSGNAAFMKQVGMRLFTEGMSKLHDQGFEVVAISLDDKESALRRFISEKELPWPQHFDGKGWENQFAVRYGVFGIPTMWLVDKRGNLRDTNARFNLERRVTELLEEQATAPK